MTRLRVLLVDDDVGFQGIYADWLRESEDDLGSEIIFDTATTVQEAVERIKLFDYDVAFVDFHLCGSSGSEVIEQSLAYVAAKGCPRFYAMTGDGRAEIIQACKNAGFVEILLKPIRRTKFIETLKIEALRAQIFDKAAAVAE